MPATAEKPVAREWPKPGDQVWFRSADEIRGFEWLPATVIDREQSLNHIERPLIFDTPFEGTLHLKVTLNRKKYHSAKSFVHRLNVPGPYEGPGGIEPQKQEDAHGYERVVGPPPGCGMWAYEKPEWAEEQTAAQLEQRRLTKHYWRENHKNKTTAGRKRGGGRRIRQVE